MHTSGGRKYLFSVQYTVLSAVSSSSLHQKHLDISGFRRRRIIMRNTEECKMQSAKCKINLFWSFELEFRILQRVMDGD